MEPARSAALWLICHSRSCSAVTWYVLAQLAGRAKQLTALLTEGYLTCPAAYPGASRNKKEYEVAPGKWDLERAA